MAATINAPPSVLWPWLVQMGAIVPVGTAGTVSTTVVFPAPGVSIQSGSTSRWGTAWTRLRVEMLGSKLQRWSRELFWLYGHRSICAGAHSPPNCPRPRYYTDSVWCFLLQELPGERTRLMVSGYTAARPKVLQAILDFVFWEPAHWIHADPAVHEPTAAHRVLAGDDPWVQCPPYFVHSLGNAQSLIRIITEADIIRNRSSRDFAAHYG